MPPPLPGTSSWRRRAPAAKAPLPRSCASTRRWCSGWRITFCRARAQAEELAQDVFLALHQNLPRVESARHLVFWLRRVTSNRCIDCGQKRAAQARAADRRDCMSRRRAALQRSAAWRAAAHAGRRIDTRRADRRDAALSGGSRSVGDRGDYGHAGQHREKPPAALDGRASPQAGRQRARI